MAMFVQERAGARTMVVAGGVAANRALAVALTDAVESRGFQLVVPPAKLCTDNGVMVAWAGLERFALGMHDELDAPARPRWPLDDDAVPKLGARA